jgi:hypothetical protein
MFTAFYSDEARQLAQWSLEEPNRVKASKMMRIAQNMERQNRIAYGDLNSQYARDMGGYYLKPSGLCPPKPPQTRLIKDFRL